MDEKKRENKHHLLTPELVDILHPIGTRLTNEQTLINFSFFDESDYPYGPPSDWASLKPQLTPVQRGTLARAIRTLHHKDVTTIGQLRNSDPKTLHKEARINLHTIGILQSIFDPSKDVETTIDDIS